MNDFYTPRYNGTAGLVEFGEEDSADDHLYGARQRSYPDAYAAYVADVWFREYHNERFADELLAGWDDEYHFGLPNRCRTTWADGALRFKPGWDSVKAPRVRPDQLPAKLEER